MENWRECTKESPGKTSIAELWVCQSCHQLQVVHDKEENNKKKAAAKKQKPFEPALWDTVNKHFGGGICIVDDMDKFTGWLSK